MPSSYRDLTTSRGVRYHYLVSPSVGDKQTLLFLHGFPSTSYDWHHQIDFFQKEGYGLIVPDLLGYGGTDKPADPALYKLSAMTTDIIDILNAENVEKAIAIGHDWGSTVASRLASYYPDRFLGFGFLAVAYQPPNPDFNIHGVLAFMKQVIGYELFGYWLFFAEEGADKVIESHWESCISILYPGDPRLWITDMAPTGALKAWLLADKKAPVAQYVTEEHRKKLAESLLGGGLAGPFNWYKVMVSGIGPEDDKNIPKENYVVNQPVFFGGAKQDYICLSEPAKATIGDLCKSVTIKEFDTDHWVQLAAPDELNKELLAWIENIVN